MRRCRPSHIAASPCRSASDEGVARSRSTLALRLERGRILGVVGESGCGKSTLIRAILGHPAQARHASTRARSGSRARTCWPSPRRELNRGCAAAASASSRRTRCWRSTPSSRSARSCWRRCAGTRRATAAATASRRGSGQLLGRVQVPDPANALERYPHQFSGGQRQRAADRRGARLRAAPGDRRRADDGARRHHPARRSCCCCASWSAELGIALLFVTHDFGVVAELCDDLCVIYAGQTVEAGAGAVDPRRAAASLHARAAGLPSRSRERFVGIPGAVPSPLRAPPGCRFAPRCGDVRPVCTRRRRRRRAGPAPRRRLHAYNTGHDADPVGARPRRCCSAGRALASCARRCRRRRR